VVALDPLDGSWRAAADHGCRCFLATYDHSRGRFDQGRREGLRLLFHARQRADRVAARLMANQIESIPKPELAPDRPLFEGICGRHRTRPSRNSRHGANGHCYQACALGCLGIKRGHVRRVDGLGNVANFRYGLPVPKSSVSKWEETTSLWRRRTSRRAGPYRWWLEASRAVSTQRA
jgi:hypothetical protein